MMSIVMYVLTLSTSTPALSPEVVSGLSEQEAKSSCCFNNPAYSGTCRVEPTEDETCASILAYLNNAMAQGKSYCGGTEVREGWTQVACKEKEDAAAGCSPIPRSEGPRPLPEWRSRGAFRVSTLEGRTHEHRRQAPSARSVR